MEKQSEQIDQRKRRKNSTIEEKQQKISELELKLTLGVITKAERKERRKLIDALNKHITSLNMSDEQRAERNEKRRLRRRELTKLRKRQEEILLETSCKKIIAKTNCLKTIAKQKEKIADSKNQTTSQTKSSQSSRLSCTRSNSDNPKNNCKYISSTTWNIDGYDSETLSCGNSHCPSSDNEENNNSIKFLLDETDLVSSTTTSQVPYDQETSEASSSNQTKTNRPERFTEDTSPKYTTWNLIPNKISQHKQTAKTRYAGKFQKHFISLQVEEAKEKLDAGESSLTQIKQLTKESLVKTASLIESEESRTYQTTTQTDVNDEFINCGINNDYKQNSESQVAKNVGDFKL